MRIAFDYDGTITKNPYLFKVFAEALKEKHELYIISGTNMKLYKELVSELSDMGLDEKWFRIVLKPKDGDLDDVTEWKKGIIDTYKIRCYFENRQKTADAINEFCTTFKIL